MGTGVMSLVAVRTEQARRIHCQKIVTIFAADDPRGDGEELEGGFP